jgi:hypothetical protein
MQLIAVLQAERAVVPEANVMSERDGIRTIVPLRDRIPSMGIHGGLSVRQNSAERVGILSTAYKSPRAAEVALTAVLNKSGDRIIKVQGLCG